MPSPNPQISFEAKKLTKSFNRRPIFKDISFSLNTGDSVSITGKNGTGKSTLIKIIASVLNQSSGETEMTVASNKIPRDDRNKYVGFVSPYLNLYDEFTGLENLTIISGIRGARNADIDGALKRVGLYERRKDLLRIYSSGMKQRLRLAFAILHNPLMLLLDEPTSNLDKDGVDVVTAIANEQKSNGILVIATNDEYEKSLCKADLNLNLLMGNV